MAKVNLSYNVTLVKTKCKLRYIRKLIKKKYLQRLGAALCHWNTWTPCYLTLSFCTLKTVIDQRYKPKTRHPWNCIQMNNHAWEDKNQLKQVPTRSKALRVATSVWTLPNIVVKPKISNSRDWNAMKIAILSSIDIRKPIHIVGRAQRLHFTVYHRENFFAKTKRAKNPLGTVDWRREKLKVHDE